MTKRNRPALSDPATCTRETLARRYAEARAWLRGSRDAVERHMSEALTCTTEDLIDVVRETEATVQSQTRMYCTPYDYAGDDDAPAEEDAAR